MKKLILVFLVFCSFQVYSQKNAVYGTYGFNSSINVERTLLASKNDNYKLNLSVGLGMISEYNLSDSEGKTAEIATNILAGGRGNYL